MGNSQVWNSWGAKSVKSQERPLSFHTILPQGLFKLFQFVLYDSIGLGEMTPQRGAANSLFWSLKIFQKDGRAVGEGLDKKGEEKILYYDCLTLL